MSYSVLRRYTPPTCTLEILAKQSSLSRWAGQSVVKDLRFHLNLDDPKLPEEEWITLRGDRLQLEALCEAVAGYVQAFLSHSHELLRPQPLLSSVEALPLRERYAEVSLAEPTVDRTLEATPNPTGIGLQAKGLLQHELDLGTLATAESGQTITLSTLQLFDLANALDDYTQDLLALPDLKQAGWLKRSPNWAQIAAVALVVVGLSTTVLKLVDGSYPVAQTAAPANSEGASSTDQKVATQLPPVVVEKSTPPLSSNQKLPPPPTPSPSPGAGLPTVPVPPVTLRPPASQLPTITAVPNAAQRPVIVPGAPAVQGTARQADPSLPRIRFESEFANESANRAAASAPRNDTADIASARAGSTRAAAPSGTAFDTIPQVAEARQYFQQRWTPPQGLTQTLEYSLQINPDGTVQRIIPLGTAAGEFVDRSGIPLVGESLVSPLPNGQSARIRLVLSPDGKVQTFLE